MFLQVHVEGRNSKSLNLVVSFYVEKEKEMGFVEKHGNI